jgi:hypothetical protein
MNPYREAEEEEDRAAAAAAEAWAAIQWLKEGMVSGTEGTHDAAFDGGAVTRSFLHRALAAMAPGEQEDEGADADGRRDAEDIAGADREHAEDPRLFRLEEALVGAFEDNYETEVGFQRAVFDAMVACFRSKPDRWIVETLSCIEVAASDDSVYEDEVDSDEDFEDDDNRALPQYMVIREKEGVYKTEIDEEEEGEEWVKVDEEHDDDGATGPGAADSARATGAATASNSSYGCHAMGLAWGRRRYCGERHVRWWSTESGTRIKEIPDGHSWVLFHRSGDGDNEPWRVSRVLAVVDLRLRPAMSAGFSNHTTRDGLLRRFHWEEGMHYPLANVIRDVIRRVVPTRAAMGLHLPERLPWAVVAANAQSDESRTETDGGPYEHFTKARWAHGYVAVPKEFGGEFMCCGDSSGPFMGTSGLSPAAAYLDVLLDGWNAGKTYVANLEDLRSSCDEAAPSLPAPRPMCGRELHFGRNAPLDLAGTLPYSFWSSSLERRLGRCDRFRGRIQLAALREMTIADKNVMWCRDSADDGVPSDRARCWFK